MNDVNPWPSRYILVCSMFRDGDIIAVYKLDRPGHGSLAGCADACLLNWRLTDDNSQALDTDCSLGENSHCPMTSGIIVADRKCEAFMFNRITSVCTLLSAEQSMRLTQSSDHWSGKLVCEDMSSVDDWAQGVVSRRSPPPPPPSLATYSSIVSLVSVSSQDLVINAQKLSITDQVSGFEWNFGGSAALTSEGGVPCVDLTAGELIVDGTGPTLGQKYTLVYYWKPLLSSSTWRTLHFVTTRSLVLTNAGTNDIGTYDGSEFYDSGYDIVPNVWQTLIITNEGDASVSKTGTSEWYSNDVRVGSLTRVGSGEVISSIGRGTQYPGHVAVAAVLNRILTRQEITNVHRMLQGWARIQQFDT